ncbi:hypothetical protein GCM10010387_20170 [Streptomyces inusitatus]|uniref:Secreted protein n=1 Tax=Streptomyces inusitatus TaxID=68221 RepID=A0A918PZ37_9ACTN|nr:hypothetical protein [Streptomyces inusitatus]GGZ26833.1 hypothetical protein GCM10010387_20170 [Streptomyces inusitatus]
MTHPPQVRSAPHPAPGPAPAPARPPGGPVAEAGSRLRAAVTTEPGRLRLIGAVLAALVVAFGAVTALEVSDRAAAAEDVVSGSQPLSADAASVYRSLADADTAASSGFLAGAVKEPASVRERYEKDIALASELLIKAATNTEGSSESGRQIATLNKELPVYTGRIEAARAHNRQGLPLGGAYLRFANEQMTKVLLPAAQKLYDAETARLHQDDEEASRWPVLSVAVGLAALGALLWAQRRTYLRTNRVFNHGLLATTAATTAALLWLTVGHTLARDGLTEAREHGQRSLEVLNDSRISSLKARANENLVLVARGAVLTDDGKSDKYETEYGAGMAELGKGLDRAGKLADDDGARALVAAAGAGVREWRDRHQEVSSTDRAGNYEGAVRKVIGAEGSTGESFDTVDKALEKALAHEQSEFTRAARDGRDALGGLPAGAAVLGLLGAVGAILGINRRLSEYR